MASSSPNIIVIINCMKQRIGSDEKISSVNKFKILFFRVPTETEENREKF
jgi:hypothetical protein